MRKYNKDEIKEILIEIYKEYGIMEMEDNSADVDINESFTAIGISSVDFIKIIVGVENKFEFEFEDDDLVVDRFKCLAELIDYIYERI